MAIDKKLQRVMDNIDLLRRIREQYYQASPKGKALCQKQINIQLRRIKDLINEIQGMGKGKMITCKYWILSENVTYEEQFIGIDKDELKQLLDIRKFLTGKDYKILEIQEMDTQIKVIPTM